MSEPANNDPIIHPVSRFSTSTSIRMASNQGHSGDVVPMPKWSRIVGFARVALAVLVLAFTAAATSIWGIYPSFGIALFTVTRPAANLREKSY